MLSKISFKNQVNAVGFLAIAIVGWYVAGDLMKSTVALPCSTRTGTITQMSFRKADGTLMSPAEFQARMGASERNLIDKTKFLSSGDGPYPVALSVAVGGAVDQDTGAGFDWPMSGIANARSACLGYSVFIPEGFNFADGGQLPGLHGHALASVEAGGIESFEAPILWNDQGAPGMKVSFDGHEARAELKDPVQLSSQWSMGRGRWVRIEQELDFGASGEEGIARLFVDGRLAAERTALLLRRERSLRFTGARGNVGYLPPINYPNRPSAALRLSPLQLSWR